MWALKTLESWHCRQVDSRSGSCDHVFWFMSFQATAFRGSRTRRGTGQPRSVGRSSKQSRETKAWTVFLLVFFF